MKVKAVAAGLAVLACGLASQQAVAFKAGPFDSPIHEQITEDALGFLRDGRDRGHGRRACARPTPVKPVENKPSTSTGAVPEGTELINSLYHDAIDELDPANPNADPWQAADDFGYLTHPTQDFYSHSNWVEAGDTDLVDSRPGLPGGAGELEPDPPRPGRRQGEMATLPAGWSVHRDPGSLVPTVTTDTNQTFKALVSGLQRHASPIPTSDDCAIRSPSSTPSSTRTTTAGRTSRRRAVSRSRRPSTSGAGC